MPIDGKLLEILCCPVSKTPLTRLSSARLEKLNTAIRAGEVKTVHGEAVEQVLSEALITEDGFDMLTGSSGSDWFIISDADKITDFKKIQKDGDLVTVV